MLPHQKDDAGTQKKGVAARETPGVTDRRGKKQFFTRLLGGGGCDSVRGIEKTKEKGGGLYEKNNQM